MATDSPGLWLYAVTDQVGDVTDVTVTGINGSPVRVIKERGLAAFVSDVGLDEFSESRLAASLDDMHWLETTATAHHKVIGALASAHRVVPMRLATVFTGEPSARAMLAQRAAEFKELLNRTSDRTELGVKAFVAQPEPQSEPRARSAMSPSDATAPAGSGLAYLQRRRTELAASKQTWQEAARSAREVHLALARLAVDVRLHAPQVHDLAGTKAPMLLNGAYLVENAEQDRFADAVGELAGQYHEIRLQLTGPWPPYSFAGFDDAEGDGT